MILHKDGKEALVNVVTNPNYQFLELSEIFLLSSGSITPVWSIEKLLGSICYAGVIHFSCDAVNLFGENLGNSRVLVENSVTGGLDKIHYDMILPIGYYSNNGAPITIYGMALVGGASRNTGGYTLSGGVPEFSQYVSTGQELIFGYELFDVPLVKTNNTSVRLQLELLW